MHKVAGLLIAIVLVVGCSNNQSSPTEEKRDSTALRDTGSNAGSNVVEQPASNGQY